MEYREPKRKDQKQTDNVLLGKYIRVQWEELLEGQCASQWKTFCTSPFSIISLAGSKEIQEGLGTPKHFKNQDLR